MAPSESETTWGEVLGRLHQRGLRGVEVVTSDAHTGLRQAIDRYCPGAAWQYCQTHFQRTCSAVVRPKQRGDVAETIRQIFNAPDEKQARKQLEATVKAYEKTQPKVAEKLDENADFLLANFTCPAPHRKRIRTTNALERLNREFARRADVVQIFPNPPACLRLMAALAMEWSEEWTTGKRYLNMGDPEVD